MNTFEFRIMKGIATNGEAGFFMYGTNPDHITPLIKINKFLGKDCLKIAGRGIGVCIFLPESKMDVWQKIAIKKSVWLKEDFGEKGMFEIDLSKL